MTNTIPNVVVTKNSWLESHVMVEFPTAASIQGHQLQLEHSTRSHVVRWLPDSHSMIPPLDMYLVDFHRLTIFFAVLQSQQFNLQSDKEQILEFFTQIILSDPCHLYLGFRDGDPVLAGMITIDDNQILFSNLVTSQAELTITDAAYLLYNQLSTESQQCAEFYLEENSAFLIS